MSLSDINIRVAKPEEIKLIEIISEENGSHKSTSYWNICKQKQILEELDFLIAIHSNHNKPVGYGILNWKPKYRVYDQLGIPEIQDLNVVRDHRRKGIATHIIQECEKRAKDKQCSQIGISFGLTKEYGYAQRLYISMGYVPDGFGVTYDREPVHHGQLRAVDDDLCLMLMKELAE